MFELVSIVQLRRSLLPSLTQGCQIANLGGAKPLLFARLAQAGKNATFFFGKKSLSGSASCRRMQVVC